MNQYRMNVHKPLESGRAALKIKDYGWHTALVVKKIHFFVQRDARCFAQQELNISSREKYPYLFI